MKGMIFTEFFSMVEEVFSTQILEKIINNANLPNKGAYTSVGYYPAEEMVTLVSELSKETSISVSDLLKSFGEHLFSRFTLIYPSFINKFSNMFDFLESIEVSIHTEVLKIYPNAELPRIITNRIDDQNFELIYKSKRNLQDLAYGLIKGCIKLYKEDFLVQAENLSDDQGNFTKFLIYKNNEQL